MSIERVDVSRAAREQRAQSADRHATPGAFELRPALPNVRRGVLALAPIEVLHERPELDVGRGRGPLRERAAHAEAERVAYEPAADPRDVDRALVVNHHAVGGRLLRADAPEAAALDAVDLVGLRDPVRVVNEDDGW